MSTLKPAILIKHPHKPALELINEDGRHVAYFLHSYDVAEFHATMRGYEVVPLNSRVARTILDKIHGEHV